MAAHLVLVHGGWGRPDDWDLVVEECSSAGVATSTVDLPSVQRADATMADDVAEVARVLESVDGDRVLVGHSYGGMVVTGASAGRQLRRLVYVTAFVPDEGEDAFTLLTSVPAVRSERAVHFRDDGTTVVDPWPLPDAEIRFGQDAVAAMATRPRRPLSMAASVSPAPAIGWREHPSTYVVATRDQVVPPDLQRRMAAPLDEVVELDTDHFPMFERPAELARILVAVAS